MIQSRCDNGSYCQHIGQRNCGSGVYIARSSILMLGRFIAFSLVFAIAHHKIFVRQLAIAQNNLQRMPLK